MRDFFTIMKEKPTEVYDKIKCTTIFCEEANFYLKRKVGKFFVNLTTFCDPESSGSQTFFHT